MGTETDSLDFTERLLAPLRHSTSPLLVWRAGGGERIELSGRVFDNWVAKSANLLQEEFDAGPGTVLHLSLPVHWKTLAIALAGLHLGATLSVGDGADGADVLAFADPDGVPSGPDLLAVGLHPLAPSFGPGLPDGALDYAAEVRAFGDYHLPDPVAGAADALRGDGPPATYSALFGLRSPGGTAALDAAAGPGAAVRAAVSVFAAGDALVLLGPGADTDQRVLDSEGVRRRLPA